MSKELLIPHDEIRDPQTITKRIGAEFEQHDLNLHTNEVSLLEDDHQRKIRRVVVKNTKYFFMGGK